MYKFTALIYKTIPPVLSIATIKRVEHIARRRVNNTQPTTFNKQLPNLVATQADINWEMLQVRLNLLTLTTGYSI